MTLGFGYCMLCGAITVAAVVIRVAAFILRVQCQLHGIETSIFGRSLWVFISISLHGCAQLNHLCEQIIFAQVNRIVWIAKQLDDSGSLSTNRNKFDRLQNFGALPGYYLGRTHIGESPPSVTCRLYVIDADIRLLGSG